MNRFFCYLLVAFVVIFPSSALAVESYPINNNVKTSVNWFNEFSVQIIVSLDKAASIDVEFGETTSYGGAIFLGPISTGHSFTLTGLKPATTYHYRIIIHDTNAPTEASKDFTFTTAADIDFSTPEVNVHNTSSATITWITSEPCIGGVEYHNNNTGSDQGIPKTISETSHRTSHSITLSNLQPSGAYYFHLTCQTADGVITEFHGEENSFLFNTPNEISNKEITSYLVFVNNNNTVSVSFTTEPAIPCQLMYSTNENEVQDIGIDSSYKNKTIINLGSGRSTTTPELTPATKYYFRVYCQDGTKDVYTVITHVTTYNFPALEQEEDHNQPQQQNEVIDDIVSEPEGSDTMTELEYEIRYNQVVQNESKAERNLDQTFANQLKGKILLQVEEGGEAWYVDPETSKKFYLVNGSKAYEALRTFGLGISNSDLEKIPVGIEERAMFTDSDGDGLEDQLEEAIGTDPNNRDSDNDSFSDGEEVKNGYNPLGAGKMNFTNLGDQLEGKIVLQVESRGEAWYIYKGERYYMRDGSAAYQIMRFLSLGITNDDLRKIEVGDF